MPVPSVLPMPFPFRLVFEPELAQEASYLAASARIANLSLTVLANRNSPVLTSRSKRFRRDGVDTSQIGEQMCTSLNWLQIRSAQVRKIDLSFCLLYHRDQRGGIFVNQEAADFQGPTRSHSFIAIGDDAAELINKMNSVGESFVPARIPRIPGIKAQVGIWRDFEPPQDIVSHLSDCVQLELDGVVVLNLDQGRIAQGDLLELMLPATPYEKNDFWIAYRCQNDNSLAQRKLV